MEVGRSFSSQTTFVVTPRVIPLPRTVVSGSWVGDGDGTTRAAASAGEDDVIPRAYRDGDELRRVHWRSTARYGELMVRREEQRWRNRVLLLLDTRRSAHAGTGPTSSFEFAVSAAASIGVHFAHEGLDGQLITDAGPVSTAGIFEDVLLDSLSVIKPSRCRDLGAGTAALRGSTSGVLVAIAGQLSAGVARQLAASRRDAGAAIALLLAVSTWSTPQAPDRPEAASRNGHSAGASNGQLLPGPGSQPTAGAAETSAAAAILRGAGWRVITVDARTPLAAAWQQLAAFPGAPGHPGGTSKVGGTAS